MSKWALVTGSADRIGRVIALDLAEAGWDIVVHYNSSTDKAEDTAKKIKALKREAHVVQADFSDKRQSEECIPSLVKDIGSLSALVNNASLFEPDSASPGGREHKSVNFEAPLLLAEAFRKQLPKGTQGAVVNILDGNMPSSGFNAYTQSKKSLRVMTIELARRMAPDVRVNGVAPGPTLISSRQSAAHFKKLVASTLLRTEVSPQSVASAVRLLIENPSITGEILHIDGGIRLLNTPSMTRAMAS
jgi:NAD(P)-dependent dehydrogenase (short-subunit alcohol dehydrogenase family)